MRARIDNKVVQLSNKKELNKNKKHNIDIIIDRLIINTAIKSRLTESVETALQLGNGSMLATINQKKDILFNKNLYCIKCNISYEELEPRFFSFNSPQGACNKCGGLGAQMKLDPDLLIPDKKKSTNW